MINKADWRKLINASDSRTSSIAAHLAHGQPVGEVLSSVRQEFPDISFDTLLQQAEHIATVMGAVPPAWLEDDDFNFLEQLVYMNLARGMSNPDELRFLARERLRALTIDEFIDRYISQVTAQFTNSTPWPPEVLHLFERRGGQRLISQDDMHFVGRIDRHAPVNSKVAFFHTDSLHGVGLISGIDQEGHVSNTVRIVPVAVRINNRTITKDFESTTFKVKDVPLICLTDAQFLHLKALLCPPKQTFPLGYRTVGGWPVFSGSQALLHQVPVSEVVDDLEARLIYRGLPSSGKSISAAATLRGLATNADLPVIAVSPFTPNLALYGRGGSTIDDPDWNISNLADSYLAAAGCDPLPSYRLIQLHENSLMPNIAALSPKTILELLVSIAPSVQITAMISARFVNQNAQDVLQAAEDGTLLRTEDGFSKDQIERTRKYAIILRNMFQGGAPVIDLGAILIPTADSPRHLGVHIPDDSVYLCELLFIVFMELLSRSRHVPDPRRDGTVLFVDELPAIYNTSGVVVSGRDVARVFRKLVLQGRNKGVLLGGILQDPAYARYFFPGKDDQYPTYVFERRGDLRMGRARGVDYIVPPVTFS